MGWLLSHFTKAVLPHSHLCSPIYIYVVLYLLEVGTATFPDSDYYTCS